MTLKVITFTPKIPAHTPNKRNTSYTVLIACFSTLTSQVFVRICEVESIYIIVNSFDFGLLLDKTIHL